MSVFDELQVDGLVITGATNRRYFSGWSADDHAPDRPSGVMLVTPSEKLLFASSTNLPWAASEALDDVTPLVMTVTWQQAISAAASERGLTRLGFEDAVLPVAAWKTLQDSLANEAVLVDASEAVDATREIKTEREQAILRKALAATDRAFEQASAAMQPGMTERALADIVENALREAGSIGMAFDVIVASGPNAAKPHHAPGDRTIQSGEPVIIDMGAKIDGYCGDLTRTIWSGQPDEQIGTIYRLVAEAQQAAIAAVRAGVEARSIDTAARQVFAAAGQEQYVAHSVGHAIGLRIHEEPFLSQQSSAVLQIGNVITIEPGLYIPGWGGVRIEDVVLVTDEGCINLTGAPKLLGVG